MTRSITLLVALSLAATTLAQTPAQEPATPPRPVRTLQVLTPEQIDPSRLLPPPPAEGSDVQQREMAEVKRLIKTRTKERYDQAIWDAEHESVMAFASVIGPGFDLEKLPATKRLLDPFVNDQAMAASQAKDFFKRKIPATVELPASYMEWTCDKTDRTPAGRAPRSYPSGRATLAYSVGPILAALMPEKSQAILARAADYAYSREVCGDHYHSDIEASHALGSALAMMLFNQPAMKAQLEAARVELRNAHLTSQ